MREVTTILPAPPDEAFRLLEDPASFEDLVAGARRIRRFDPRWPEPGTLIHHTVGIPPVLVRDQTGVVEIERPRRLLLDAHLWPFGTLTVEFVLEPHPEGTRLAVRETPQRGPLSWPGVNRVTEVGVMLRNKEICRRYRRLVEARQRARGGPAGA